MSQFDDDDIVGIETRLQLVLKRLMGRTTTTAKVGDGVDIESIPSNIQTSASTIFGEKVPDLPVRPGPLNGIAGEAAVTGTITDSNGNVLTTVFTDGVVESIKLELVPINASSYQSDIDGDKVGVHGYYAKLPSDYETTSNNLKKYHLTNNPNSLYKNDQKLYETQGRVQCIPPIYGFDENTVYTGTTTDYRIYGAVLRDAGNNIIEAGDDRNWYFDYYSGVYFQERVINDPNFQAPASIEVLVYIGNYV